MSKHDRLGMRICMILERLFLGKTLSIAELADEFNVSRKTISRDFNNRLLNLSDIDIEMVKKGYYKLSKHYANSLKSYSDILHFSQIIYIDRLFPKHAFDYKFIKSLLSNKTHSPCIIYTEPLDEQPNMYGPFLTLTQAIIDKVLITIKTKSEVFNDFAAYRLIHYKRRWYLVGELDKYILVINYESINEITRSENYFKFDLNISETIQEEAFIRSLPHFNYTAQVFHKIKKHNIKKEILCQSLESLA